METAARSFTGFIVEAKRNELVFNLQKAKFLSLLLDGSTDAENVDNEHLVPAISREELQCMRLVGVGIDGAAANVASAG